MSVLPARTRSACGLGSYLFSGGGAEVAGAQSEWREGPDTEKDVELAGQVAAKLANH